MLTGSFGTDILINTFGNKENMGNEEINNGSRFINIIFNLLIGFSAAYLSWKCGEKANNEIVYRVLNALFAYIFGLLYLILYIIKIGCCHV